MTEIRVSSPSWAGCHAVEVDMPHPLGDHYEKKKHVPPQPAGLSRHDSRYADVVGYRVSRTCNN